MFLDPYYSRGQSAFAQKGHCPQQACLLREGEILFFKSLIMLSLPWP